MHNIRHITADSSETVEITWEFHNQSGQVIDRYTQRFMVPPKDVREARTVATIPEDQIATT